MYSEIVSKEQAERLKKLDFDLQVHGFYHLGLDNVKHSEEPSNFNFESTIFASAPTFGEVVDWLLAKGIYVSVSLDIVNGWWATYEVNLDSKDKYRGNFVDGDYTEPSAALTAGIESALQYLEGKK